MQHIVHRQIHVAVTGEPHSHQRLVRYSRRGEELFFFFFNGTPTTEIYTSLHTLSLHDALPIFRRADHRARERPGGGRPARRPRGGGGGRSEEHTSELQSRNDSSYAVFCLK